MMATLTAIEIELALATGLGLIGLAFIAGMSIAAWKSRRRRRKQLEKLR